MADTASKSQKLLPLLLYFFATFSTINASAQQEEFFQRTVISNLDSPWEIIYGPHDSLWITESNKYLVKRVDIKTGKSTTLLDLSKEIKFDQTKGKPPQGGLMGMALHPSFFKSDSTLKPYVYLAYVYERLADQPCGTDAQSNTPCNFKTKIVRYEYKNNQLINPASIIESLPGSNDHNSGRLLIGGDAGRQTTANNKYYLYYTIGDMGAGQFNNMTRVNHAQNINVAEGKILRFNTEPDGDNGLDSWIPDDNPFYQKDTISPKDYVFSYGHRNAQGIVLGGPSHTIMYSSEHGPQSDDEINLISKGGNYGWNKIAGYRDGNYDGMKLGGVGPVNEEQFSSKTIDPIFSLFPAPASTLKKLTQDSYKWPSVAPSSIDYYGSEAIPEWNNSLLVTTLKAGKLYRFKLNPEGTGVLHARGQVDSLTYFQGEGRFRDLAISPDGARIYIACDKGGPALGKNKAYNKDGTPPAHAGSILEFTYLRKDQTTVKRK